MAKLILTDIASGFASTTAINDNYALIEAAVENTLSRDGTTPNQMGADFDMNSNDILNLPNAVDMTSPVPLGQLSGLLQGIYDGNIIKLREVHTATAGQTVFNLSGLTYVPASNNLSIYINGIKQRVTSSYLETDNNTITFTETVPVTAVVEFIVNDDI